MWQSLELLLFLHFYYLRTVRLELDEFIESIGYEPIQNVEDDISYVRLKLYKAIAIKKC